MSAVLSLEQNRSVSPLEYYQAAMKALDACTSVDETMYWDNKADALTAWAKINQSPEAELNAKRLKLYAYRRMGQLAAELRPARGNRKPGDRSGTGALPGPVSLLKEHGLNRTRANAARKLGQLSAETFQALLEHPLAPTTAMNSLNHGEDPAWIRFHRSSLMLRACLRKFPPKELSAVARRLNRERRLRTVVGELLTLLGEFDFPPGNDS